MTYKFLVVIKNHWTDTIDYVGIFNNEETAENVGWWLAELIERSDEHAIMTYSTSKIPCFDNINNGTIT